MKYFLYLLVAMFLAEVTHAANPTYSSFDSSFSKSGNTLSVATSALLFPTNAPSNRQHPFTWGDWNDFTLPATNFLAAPAPGQTNNGGNLTNVSILALRYQGAFGPWFFTYDSLSDSLILTNISSDPTPHLQIAVANINVLSTNQESRFDGGIITDQILNDLTTDVHITGSIFENGLIYMDTPLVLNSAQRRLEAQPWITILDGDTVYEQVWTNTTSHRFAGVNTNAVFVGYGGALSNNLTIGTGPYVAGNTNNIFYAPGYATYNTNQFAVAASGWTNTNAFNCVIYFVPTGASYVYSDGTNTIRSLTTVTSTIDVTYDMHPSYKVVVSAGSISGNAVVQ